MPAKRSLGRGLDALLPKVEKEHGARQVAIGDLSVSSYQPRKYLDPEGIAELASSIADKGILQPLLVRPLATGFEIVAGERRFRAAQQAGLSTVPVLVKDLSDRETVEVALIENVQRENLTPVEEARAFQQLVEFGMAQYDVARAVGKSRSSVANTLRLLQLDEAALEALATGSITAGHARALLAQPEADRAWALAAIIEQELSVRRAEKLEAPKSTSKAKKRAIERTVSELELNLARAVGTKVRVTGDDKGRIELHFASRDELERLLELLRYQP